jgi:hypothetical protein
VSRAFVSGLGLCVPRHSGAVTWQAAFPDVALSEATGELLPPALRRRASSLARMAAAVAGQAAHQASVDLSRVPIILGSAYGEIVVAVEMMREFDGPTALPSPTRFHNSVHNAAAAYLSIATGNRGFSTALAAGTATPAVVVFEAVALLGECGGDALLVLLDEPPPSPFERAEPYPAAAVAFCLSSRSGPQSLAALSEPRRGSTTRADLPDGLERHPCAGAFALLAAVASLRSGNVSLGADAVGDWLVDVSPVP